jgi:hypothetical protein
MKIKGIEFKKIDWAILAGFPFMILVIGWVLVLINEAMELGYSKKVVDGLVLTSVVIFYSDILLEMARSRTVLALLSSVLVGGYANLIYSSNIGFLTQPFSLCPIIACVAVFAAWDDEYPSTLLLVSGTVFLFGGYIQL